MTFPLPNVLTGLRILAVPTFIWLSISGNRGAALCVFIGAALTDALDGALARALKQFTKLGAALDPLADKALGLAAICVLTWSGGLPPWLLVISLARDACIILAIWILERTGRKYALRPTRFGKYTTFFLLSTIVLALVQDFRPPSPQGHAALLALCLACAECILVSWVQYFILWRRLMNLTPGTPPEVLDEPREGAT